MEVQQNKNRWLKLKLLILTRERLLIRGAKFLNPTKNTVNVKKTVPLDANNVQKNLLITETEPIGVLIAKSRTLKKKERQFFDSLADIKDKIDDLKDDIIEIFVAQLKQGITQMDVPLDSSTDPEGRSILLNQYCGRVRTRKLKVTKTKGVEFRVIQPSVQHTPGGVVVVNCFHNLTIPSRTLSINYKKFAEGTKCYKCATCSSINYLTKEHLLNPKLRCGMCSNQMYSEYILYARNPNLQLMAPDEQSLIHFCGINLSQLMKMGYGDIYEILNPNDRKRIEDHDYQLYKSWKSWTYFEMVLVPNDTEPWLINMFEGIYSGLIVVPSPRILGRGLTYSLDLQCIILAAIQTTDYDIDSVIGGVWYQSNLNIMQKNVITEVDNNVNSIKGSVVVLDSHNLGVLENLLNDMREVVIIVPKIEAIPRNQKFNQQGSILLCVQDECRPITFNFEIGSHSIIIKGKTYGIKLIVDGYYNVAYEIIHKQLTLNETIVSYSKVKYINYNYIGDSGTNLWSGYSISRCINYQLDIELLRSLFMRNLNGTATKSDMRKYAVAYIKRRFSINEKATYDKAIDIMSIDAHIQFILDVSSNIIHRLTLLTDIPQWVISIVRKISIVQTYSSNTMTDDNLHLFFSNFGYWKTRVITKPNLVKPDNYKMICMHDSKGDDGDMICECCGMKSLEVKCSYCRPKYIPLDNIIEVNFEKMLGRHKSTNEIFENKGIKKVRVQKNEELTELLELPPKDNLMTYLEAARKNRMVPINKFDRDMVITSEDGIIDLPFVSMGHGKLAKVNIIDLVDRRNEWKDACGIMAINGITNLKITQEEAIQKVGRSENLFTEDVINLLESYGINCIMITKEAAYYNKCIENDHFVCIAHGSVIMDGFLHFMECKIVVNTECYYKCFEGGMINDISRKALLESRGYDSEDIIAGNIEVPLNINKEVERMLAEEVVPIGLRCKNSSVVNFGSVNYLSNNLANVTNTSGTLYSVELDANWTNRLTIFNDNVVEFNSLSWLNKTVIEDKNSTDEEIIDNEIRICLKSLVLLELSGYKENIINCELELIPSDGCSVVRCDYTLKDGDEIFVEELNRIVTIYKIGTKLCTDKLTDKFCVLKARKPTISTGNVWRKIAYILANKERKQRWNPKVMRLVDGVAGCGKSRSILEVSKEKPTIIIGRTKGSINNMKNYFGDEATVMSPFQYMFLLKNSKHSLIIDECYSLSRADLILLNNDNVEEIYLFGDHRQISDVDFAKQSGYKEKLDLNREFVNKVTTINKSRRVGQVLGQEIQELYPEFEPAEHTTTYEYKKVSAVNAANIVETTELFKPNIILVMDNRGLNYIRPLFKNEKSKIKIDKVHASQGITAGRVLLILSDFGTNNWNLNGNIEYLYSAVTRAEFALFILTDGVTFDGKINSLIKRGGNKSGWYDEYRNNLIKSLLRAKYGDTVRLEANKIVYTKLNTVIGTVTEDNQFIIENNILTKMATVFNLIDTDQKDISRQMCAVMVNIICNGKLNFDKSIRLNLEYRTIVEKGQAVTLQVRDITTKKSMYWPLFSGIITGERMKFMDFNPHVNFFTSIIDYISLIIRVLLKNIDYTEDFRPLVIIEQEIGFFDFYCAGKNMWPKGMYLTREQHNKFNTNVSKIFTDTEANVMMSIRKYSNKTFNVTSNNMELLEKLGENYCPNTVVNSTQSTFYDDESSQIVTVMSMYKVAVDRKEKRIGYFGIYPELLYLNYMPYINIIVPTELNNFTNTIINSIERLTKELKIKKRELFEGESYITIKDVLLMDCIILDEHSFNEELVIDLLNNNKEVWLIKSTEEKNLSGGYGKEHISRKITRKGRKFIDIAGVGLYKLNTVDKIVINNWKTGKLVPMQMYDLPRNLDELKYGITQRKVLIDIDLFGKCYSKLLSFNCNFGDLLRYVQSLGLTYKVSKGTLERYKSFDPDVWLNTSYFAYISFKCNNDDILTNITNKVDEFIRNNTKEENALNHLIKYVYSLIRPVMTDLSNTVSDIAGDILQDLQSTIIGNYINISKLLNAEKNQDLVYNIRNHLEWSIYDSNKLPEPMKNVRSNFNNKDNMLINIPDVQENITVSNVVKENSPSTIFSFHNQGDLDILVTYTGNRSEVIMIYNIDACGNLDNSDYKMTTKIGLKLGTKTGWLDSPLTEYFSNILKINGLQKLLENKMIVTDYCSSIFLTKLGIRPEAIVDIEENHLTRRSIENLGLLSDNEIQSLKNRMEIVVAKPIATRVLDIERIVMYDSGVDETYNLFKRNFNREDVYFTISENSRIDLHRSYEMIKFYVSRSSYNGIKNAFEIGLTIVPFSYPDDSLMIPITEEESISAIKFLMEEEHIMYNETTAVTASDIITRFDSDDAYGCVQACVKEMSKELSLSTQHDLEAIMRNIDDKILPGGFPFLLNFVLDLSISVINDDSLFGYKIEGGDEVVKFVVNGRTTVRHMTLADYDLEDQVLEPSNHNLMTMSTELMVVLLTDRVKAINSGFYFRSKLIEKCARSSKWFFTYEIVCFYPIGKGAVYELNTDISSGIPSGYCLTNFGWKMYSCSFLNNKIYMYVEGGRLITNIAYVGGWVRHINQTSRLAVTKKYALELQTASEYARQFKVKLPLLTDEKGITVIIYEFDNRKHHKYNLLEKCKGNEIILYNQELNTMTKIDMEPYIRTHNFSHNRRVIHKGWEIYSTSYNKSYLAFYDSFFIYGSEPVGVNMYHTEFITEVWFENKYEFKEYYIEPCMTEETAREIISKYMEAGLIPRGKYRIEKSRVTIEVPELGMDWFLYKDYVYVRGFDGIFVKDVSGKGPQITFLNQREHVQPKWIMEKQMRTVNNNTLDYTNLELLWNEEQIQSMSDSYDQWYGITNIFMESPSDCDYVNKVSIMDLDNCTILEESELSHVHNLFDMDYWLRTDLSMENYLVLPTEGEYTYRMIPKDNKEQFETYTEFPERVRPVITKGKNSEQRAIASRLYGVIDYRTGIEVPLRSKIIKFVDYWIKEEMKCNLSYDWPIEHQIKFNLQLTCDWIQQCLTPEVALNDLEKSFMEGWTYKNLNDCKIHLKVESVLKNEMITQEEELNARIIVWQARFVAALFTPVFKQAKLRMKAMLNNNVQYTDGMSYNQIRQFLKTIKVEKYMYCNDLKKQDRQTDKDLLEVEMNIFLLLGISPYIVKMWSCMHWKWRWMAKQCKGWNNFKRHTGSVTTAFGNLITDMQVSQVLLEMLNQDYAFIMMLGDDSIVSADSLVDIKRLERRVKGEHNMECTMVVHNYVGDFCGALIGQDSEEKGTMVPDIIKLYYKYQVPNLEHKNMEGIDEQRKDSYRAILGIKETLQWYDMEEMLTINSNYYNMDVNVIMEKFNQLKGLLSSSTKFAKEFDV